MIGEKNEVVHNIRTRFQVGDFKYVIESQKKGRFGEDIKDEMQFLMYRSMISIGQAENVLKSIDNSQDLPPHLISARYLAEYYLPAGKDEDRNKVLESMKEAEKNPVLSQSLYFRIAHATVLMSECKFEEALKILFDAHTETLEMFVICFVIMEMYVINNYFFLSFS